MSEAWMDKIGKVAVLLGGTSAEREVSLRSGQAVLKALNRSNIDAIAFDPKEQPLAQLVELGVTRVWNALHGRGGEDGRIQAALEYMGIRYTGSGVLGSAIAMDKWRSKMIWKAMGLPVAAHVLVTEELVLSDDNLRKIIARLGPVTFVKPSHEGSSVGMSKATNLNSLRQAIELARNYDQEVLVESFIEGREYTVALLNGKALPSISMVTPREFYDYEAKYLSNETKYFCPSGLSDEEEAELAEIAIKAFAALGCSGWGRIDCIRDKYDGSFKLLEANTVPGMTETSLVPKAAKQAGMSFDQLVIEILKTSL
jgi:D-alanine-D-alanine ligase